VKILSGQMVCSRLVARLRLHLGVNDAMTRESALTPKCNIARKTDLF